MNRKNQKQSKATKEGMHRVVHLQVAVSCCSVCLFPKVSFLLLSFSLSHSCLNIPDRRRATTNPVANRPRTAAAAKVANQQFVKKQSQVPKHGPFVINVFFLGSSTPPIELVVNNSDTMETVKSKIEFQHGISAERMHLFVGRRQISSNASGKKMPTVGSCGLKPGNELNVAFS